MSEDGREVGYCIPVAICALLPVEKKRLAWEAMLSVKKNGSGLLSGGHRPDPRPAECTYRARDEPVHEEGRGAAAYPAVDEDETLQSTYPIPNG